MKKILDYIEAKKIVSESNGVFYETKHVVDGYDVSVFNYRLATYSSFSELNYLELRGLTFVFNKDGSLFKRYLLVEKFFNINENESTRLEDLKKLTIKSVYEKEDGSIVSFVKLPNNKVVAKSKASFDSYQAVSSNKIYQENVNLQKFVNESLDNDLSPIFEYVSPFNKVVLIYEKDELILLRLRNNITGEYLDIENIPGIKIPKRFDYSLDQLEELSKTVENKEGWVIEFTNNLKVKQKTDFYFRLHKLYTEDLNREDYLIEKIVKEEIDDVVSILDNSDYHNFIREKVGLITNTISNYIDSKSKKVIDLYNIFKAMGDTKKFVSEFLKHPEFSYVMNLDKLDRFSKKSSDEIKDLERHLQILNSLDLENQIKTHILARTYRLENAKSWLLSKNSELIKYLNK